MEDVMLVPNEELAAYAHDAWAGWMKYLFEKSYVNPDGSVTIPPELVDRWTRQMQTAYKDLPESEKESDRAEALKMMEIFLGDGRLGRDDPLPARPAGHLGRVADDMRHKATAR